MQKSKCHSLGFRSFGDAPGNNYWQAKFSFRHLKCGNTLVLQNGDNNNCRGLITSFCRDGLGRLTAMATAVWDGWPGVRVGRCVKC